MTYFRADVSSRSNDRGLMDISGEGIFTLPTAVDAIVNFVKPEKQRALRRYLGMVNYYHRLIHTTLRGQIDVVKHLTDRS